MPQLAPKITYTMDDMKFGEVSVAEPSRTFTAKSFMDGHVLYVLDKNANADAGGATLVYMNPGSALFAVRSVVAGLDSGDGHPEAVAITMRGPCFTVDQDSK